MTLTEDQINEIAEQLDCGFRCFVHKQTKELVFIPDTNRNPDMDMEVWAEENEKLENNFFEYAEIESLESHDSFRIMEEFAETLDDSNRLKDSLYEALNQRKSFRNFKNMVDNSGDYRQAWFDFKKQWLNAWVKERIEQIENADENKANA